MCVAVRYKNQYIDTIGDLKKLIGANNVISDKGANLDGDEFCLCNVDLAENAKRIGCCVKYAENGDVEFKEVVK